LCVVIRALLAALTVAFMSPSYWFMPCYSRSKLPPSVGVDLQRGWFAVRWLYQHDIRYYRWLPAKYEASTVSFVSLESVSVTVNSLLQTHKAVHFVR